MEFHIRPVAGKIVARVAAILIGISSFGLGPGFLWKPKFAKGNLSIVGKFMHDVTATNRFKSTYGSLGAAWKF